MEFRDAPDVYCRKSGGIFSFGGLIQRAFPFNASIVKGNGRERPNLPTVNRPSLESASFATSLRTNAASPPSFLFVLSSTPATFFFLAAARSDDLCTARANSIAVPLPHERKFPSGQRVQPCSENFVVHDLPFVDWSFLESVGNVSSALDIRNVDIAFLSP